MDSCRLEPQIAAAELRQVYYRLFAHHGPQYWWPAQTPFEVMIGAVLTQNTAWLNVERALANLKALAPLSPEPLLTMPLQQLGECLRPVGYFNVKAKRLRCFCAWYIEQGGYERLSQRDTAGLRRALLKVSGIGPETADDILLYAFERPVFVIDAYTRRLFGRLALIEGHEDYETLRAFFEAGLGPDLFNEYHALIVRHAKEVCRKQPRCGGCCLSASCAFANPARHRA
jgi:endonuclease-3 related protein